MLFVEQKKNPDVFDTKKKVNLMTRSIGKFEQIMSLGGLLRIHHDYRPFLKFGGWFKYTESTYFTYVEPLNSS